MKSPSKPITMTVVLAILVTMLASCGQSTSSAKAPGSDGLVGGAAVPADGPEKATGPIKMESGSQKILSDLSSALPSSAESSKAQTTETQPTDTESLPEIKEGTVTTAAPPTEQTKKPVSTSPEEGPTELTLPPATPDVQPDDFSKFSAIDINGRPVDQSILNGHKLTVFDFWGTFCYPCIEGLGEMAALKKEFDPSDLNIIGVVVDAVASPTNYSMENVKRAKDLIAATGADYTHILPSMDLFTIYMHKVSSIPAFVIVDENGKIVDSFIGRRDINFWRNKIKEHLGEE